MLRGQKLPSGMYLFGMTPKAASLSSVELAHIIGKLCVLLGTEGA